MAKFDFSGGKQISSGFGQASNPDIYTGHTVTPSLLPTLSSSTPKPNLFQNIFSGVKDYATNPKKLFNELGIGTSHTLSKMGAAKQDTEAANILSNSSLPFMSQVGKDQQARIQQQSEFLKANPVNTIPGIIGEQIPMIPLWMKGEQAVSLAGKGLSKLAPSLAPTVGKVSAKIPSFVKGGLKDTATFGAVVAPTESIRDNDSFSQFLDREKQLPGVFLGGAALRGVGAGAKLGRDVAGEGGSLKQALALRKMNVPTAEANPLADVQNAFKKPGLRAELKTVPRELSTSRTAPIDEGLSKQYGNVSQWDDNTFNSALEALKTDNEEKINALVKYYQSYKSQGVTKGGIGRDAEGEVVTAWGTMSNNDPWYQAAYQKYGRKPNKQELREFATDELRNGRRNSLEGDIPPDTSFSQNERDIENLIRLKNPQNYKEVTGARVPTKQVSFSEPQLQSGQKVSTAQPLSPQVQRVEPMLEPRIEPRLTPGPTRPVETPELMPRERQFAQNVRDSQVAPGSVKQNTLDNPLTYEPITNKETLAKANFEVNADPVKARNMFDSPSNGISADDVALGESLIVKAIKDGDTAGANKLIADLAEKLTQAGQAVQAASIFKRMTPEGMLLYAQRIINSTKKDLLEKMGKKAPKVELTPEDSKFITDTMTRVQKLDDGREKDIAMGQIMQLIADKVPASLTQKLLGLQRISLLLNPKTMGRNVLGNTIFGAIDNLSNVVATPIDKAVGKLTGKRTATLPSITGQLKSGLRGVKETIEDAKMGIDTYSAKTQYELPSGRTFDTKVLHNLDKATKVGLQLGDRPFYSAAYDDVLRQQMKLAKVTTPTQEMIEQAHKVAQQRTYQDVNSMTKMFKLAQRSLNADKSIGLGNVVLPFVKTPANLLARAVEYSPIGITKAISEATKIGKGTFDQRTFVDSISRSVTGTAIIMVGYDLAKRGLITGSGNKDKDVAAFERGLGKNDFAFKVGDKYYTYSWAQPASMAMAVGADIFLKGKDRKDAENVVFDAVKSGGETLFKQSVMQGLQRFMGGYAPMENLAETAINAPTQLIPTLFNQVGQYSDSTQRSTYDPTNIGTGKNLLKARIPGLNRTLEPKVDVFGDTVQRNQGRNNIANVFLNPGSYSTFKPNKVQSELIRLYESTGEKGIFPQVAPKSLTNDGKSITLTPKEITQFQTTMGKNSKDRMKDIVETKVPDKEKIKDLEEAIKKAYEDAKLQLLRNRGIK